MEYNSSIKNNDFMQFSGKWLEVENSTKCGNSVTKEEAQYVVTGNWILIPKVRNTQDSIPRPYEV